MATLAEEGIGVGSKVIAHCECCRIIVGVEYPKLTLTKRHHKTLVY